MSKYLLQCDMFGYQPSLQIQNSNGLKSTFGAFLSLCLIGVVMASVWIFGKDVIFREEPNVISTIYNDPDPLRINMTDNNFIFSVGVTFPNNTMFIDDRIFTLNVQQISMFRSGNGKFITKIKNITIVPCNMKNITIVPEYFKNMDVSTLLCMKNGTAYIKGDFGQDEYTYLHFGFNRCQNTTENNNHCKSKEDISLYLNGGYISMFMSDTFIVPKNFSSPFTKFGKNLYDSMSDNIYKEYNIYLQTLQINSDQGWLLEDISNNSSFKIDTTQQMWDMRNTTGMFYSLNLRCSLNREVLSRKYIKVQTVGANVGGVIKFLLILGEIVVYYYRNLHFNEYLAEIFSNLDEEEFGKKDKKEIKISLGLNCHRFKTSNHNCPDHIQNSKKFTKAKKLSFCDKLYPHCFKSTTFKKRLDKINRIYDKLKISFDWINFIKIQRDISQLKIFLSKSASDLDIPSEQDKNVVNKK